MPKTNPATEKIISIRKERSKVEAEIQDLQKKLKKPVATRVKAESALMQAQERVALIKAGELPVDQLEKQAQKLSKAKAEIEAVEVEIAVLDDRMLALQHGEIEKLKDEEKYNFIGFWVQARQDIIEQLKQNPELTDLILRYEFTSRRASRISGIEKEFLSHFLVAGSIQQVGPELNEKILNEYGL